MLHDWLDPRGHGRPAWRKFCWLTVIFVMLFFWQNPSNRRLSKVGCVYLVFLPAEGAENATFSPHIHTTLGPLFSRALYFKIYVGCLSVASCLITIKKGEAKPLKSKTVTLLKGWRKLRSVLSWKAGRWFNSEGFLNWGIFSWKFDSQVLLLCINGKNKVHTLNIHCLLQLLITLRYTI